MPGNNVHVLVACLVFVACLYFSGWWWAIIYLPIVALYALLADMDSPISTAAVITRKFSIFGFLLGGLAYYFFQKFEVGIFAGFCLIVLVAQTVSTHRGFIHTILAGVFLSSPLLYLGLGFFIAAVFGYSSHLLLDGEFKLWRKKTPMM